MAEQLKELFTVVFLGDQQPPTKLVMLKRTSGRYGGDLYTGIGGHFDPDKDPTMLASAERELSEEVEELAGTPISEFARCTVNSKLKLHYFWGQIDAIKPLPMADEREGEISWVPVGDLFGLDIFPTTKPVLKEWAKRGFRVDRPWTLEVSGLEDENRVTRNVVVQKVEEGLL